MKNDEDIIREEAKDFYNALSDYRSGKLSAIEDFHDIKGRLYDFYTPISQAIFLDEIEKCVKSNLQSHIEQKHNGEPKPNCHIEKRANKLLFYIRQELDTLPKVVHQRFKDNEQHVRDKVFVSYSHKDKAFLTDIKRHFKPFLKDVDLWDDTRINPGEKWKDEIETAIAKSKVAILLVSTDFLGSDFIATDELPPILEASEKDGATILTVILKPCLFEDFEELNQYQTMNPPDFPISKMNENEREELYVNLVRQTKKILNT